MSSVCTFLVDYISVVVNMVVGVTQEGGKHRGVLLLCLRLDQLRSAVLAFIFIARMVQSSLPLVNNDVDVCM